MEGQLTLLDMPQTKPDYHGATDEITRWSIEVDFENQIKLQKCPYCGKSSKEYFRSCHEYFVKCPHCGIKTKYHRHAYEAKQAWNRSEVIAGDIKGNGEPHYCPNCGAKMVEPQESEE